MRFSSRWSSYFILMERRSIVVWVYCLLEMYCEGNVYKKGHNILSGRHMCYNNMAWRSENKTYLLYEITLEKELKYVQLYTANNMAIVTFIVNILWIILWLPYFSLELSKKNCILPLCVLSTTVILYSFQNFWPKRGKSDGVLWKS